MSNRNRKKKSKATDPTVEPVVDEVEKAPEFETDVEVTADADSEPLIVEPTAEEVAEVTAPKTERPSGAASLESWGMSGTGQVVEVEPASETQARNWRFARGEDLGPCTHRFASFSMMEDRDDQIPVDNSVMYVVEWRKKSGDGFPTASVPPVIADYLRSCNDSRRKYAEL